MRKYNYHPPQAATLHIESNRDMDALDERTTYHSEDITPQLRRSGEGSVLLLGELGNQLARGPRGRGEEF